MSDRERGKSGKDDGGKEVPVEDLDQERYLDWDELSPELQKFMRENYPEGAKAMQAGATPEEVADKMRAEVAGDEG